ncbi:MAG: biotin--[acetyl-CoA-carboxylase] ligase [Candidatus Enterenecus sp.]
MDTEKLNGLLGPDSPFAGRVTVLDRVDSTNTRLKELAEAGAPEFTALLAEEQTAGRGTAGRSFCSPRGEGLYLSVLLRPRVGLEELLTLTGWTAAAVREGIRAASGAPVRIKWLNDIYLNGRKLCGILTELPPLRGEAADWAVVGVGVNVTQSAGTFARQGLEGIATSLAMEGYAAGREELAAAILGALEEMYRAFPARRADYLARYRAHCMTLGRRVRCADGAVGRAVGIDDSFALEVAGEGGVRAVTAGTVQLLNEEDGL